MQIKQARGGYRRWLLATRDLSPHTIRAYDADLTSFERHLGTDVATAEIDRDDVIAFIERQKEAGLSPASLKRRASALRGFCRWMLSRDLLAVDPWSGTTLALSQPRKLPRTLPTHELNRLMQFLALGASLDIGAKPNRRAVEEQPHESTTLLAVSLMVATGVRVNESVTIKCRDIDLPARALRLVGKGRRERQVFLTNDWIASLTNAYVEVRSSFDLDHSHLLFNLRYEPLTPPAMRSRLAKAARAAGLETHVTPHMLRHTAATQLIEAGVDIRYIQRLLGHASLSTTEIYTHVSDRALRRVVSEADVLGRFVQGR
jgi:site-specific recombinase XerD